MITRELKLKLTKTQEDILFSWLMSLVAIYNWGLSKIERKAEIGEYYSEKDFCNLLANHSKKMGMPSHTIQAILDRAWSAWDRCFKKLGRKPRFKSVVYNKIRSIPFPDPIKSYSINCEKKRIMLPGIGSVRFHKQEIPEGKIKRALIVKKASGWYLQLTIEAKQAFSVKVTDKQVGIDTGFKHLVVLSDGTKIENQRNYVKGQERLAQAQRGGRKKLTARLHEKTANRRKDYNHKVSREIVDNNAEIYCTNDNLKGQAKKFGKSIGDAGISQLRQFISYKSDNHGRKFVLVDSKKTTMTCSDCGALTGPQGWAGLSVRFWECSCCGARHDRDINSANVILKIGLGLRLVLNKEDIQCWV